jgi:hypothetical protein
MVWLTADMRATRYRAKGEWVNLVGATFETVDFSGSTFHPFNAQASRFIACDFTKVKMKSGCLGIEKGDIQSVYRDCIFDRTDLRGAVPGNARFERCLFRDSRLDHWTALTAEFIDCAFEGRLIDVRFGGATSFPSVETIGVGRNRNAFHGNDFSAAELVRVEFILGIDLAANRLPQGPEYVVLDRLHDRIVQARVAVSRWADDSDRETGLLWLRILSEGGYIGQSSLHARRADIAAGDGEVGARLLELLGAPLD